MEPFSKPMVYRKTRDQCIGYACVPGSLRVYMDSHPTERFGAIYLDYCCRLGAGKFSVEMSPTADLETLFRHGLCDRNGCVLAITLAKEDRDRDLRGDEGAVLMGSGHCHSVEVASCLIATIHTRLRHCGSP